MNLFELLQSLEILQLITLQDHIFFIFSCQYEAEMFSYRKAFKFYFQDSPIIKIYRCKRCTKMYANKPK